MFSVTLSLSSLAALGAAQTLMVGLFLNGGYLNPQNATPSLVGSIAGQLIRRIYEDSTVTTYVVKCLSTAAAAATTYAATYQAYQSSVDSVAIASSINGLSPPGGAPYEPLANPYCPYPTPFTVVQGPSTVTWGYGLNDDSKNFNTAAEDCTLQGTTLAACTLSASGPLANGISVTSTTYTGTEVSFDTVLIIAGAASTTSISATARVANSGSSEGLAPGNEGSVTGSARRTRTVIGSTGTSSSFETQSTNVAVQGLPALGAGIIGVLGAAVAGAHL
ncbi:hypothetical protein N7G274_005115 [Stereocaulon virgatum]|uniref:Uncharacterized protein n=1 Tax=Stereocaulon virgatum TaxID=373712 RepID=A0ABR4ABQ5_9LECA